MADAAPRGRGGFGSRGDRGGDRRGRGRGRGRRGGKQEEKEWQPVTKLGRLVKAGKITSMEQIYLHSLPIKEYQIVDFFLPKLKDEVMKVRYNKPCDTDPTMRTIGDILGPGSRTEQQQPQQHHGKELREQRGGLKSYSSRKLKLTAAWSQGFANGPALSIFYEHS